jgi:SAM-dependent methyltransferase
MRVDAIRVDASGAAVSEPMNFTGERFTPECVREIWYEHWHRYALARRFVAGKRVLDVACGEGYGSALLARVAASVTGVDIGAEAVAHARSRYGAVPHLRYLQGDATALDLPAACFDVIVCFETLEHLHDHEALLAGFQRLLAPGGLLLISSPDKRTYSDLPGFRNEHHVRELYRDEFEALLARHFPATRLLGQKLLFQSVIWDLREAPTRALADTASGQGERIEPGLHYAPIYYLAICARAAADLPADSAAIVSVFGDREESVYTHYNAEIRHHIDSGAVFADLERRLREAEQALALAQTRARDAETALQAAESPRGLFASLRRWLAR